MIYKNLKYFLLIIVLFNAVSFAQVNKKIATFGSSVCNGTGDESNLGGYSGRLTALMKKYKYEVISVSRGGDNTKKIQDRWEKTDIPPIKEVKDNQYLIPVNPKYVLIGLSLANEGLLKKSPEGRDSVYQQYKTGIQGIIEKCRSLGYLPIVANCYPNNEYKTEEYEAIMKMNLEISSWNVPSVNLMGSVDDGTGKWAEGFYREAWHPNSGGHREMFFTIPPTLFAALDSGKSIPKFIASKNYAMISASKEPAFIFEPKDTIHAFTASFTMRNPGLITLFKTEGHEGKIITSSMIHNNNNVTVNNIYASKKKITSELRCELGKLIYISSKGDKTEVPFLFTANSWVNFTITHQPSTGETNIYAKGKPIITVKELIIPERLNFCINGKAEFRDILVYRSALNNSEVMQNVKGRLFTSSLEIFSPLIDSVFKKGISPVNYAQSLSGLKVKGVVEGTKL